MSYEVVEDVEILSFDEFEKNKPKIVRNDWLCPIMTKYIEKKVI